MKDSNDIKSALPDFDFNGRPRAHCTDGPFAPVSPSETEQRAAAPNAPVGHGTYFLGGKL